MCNNRRSPPGEKGMCAVSKMGGGMSEGEMSVQSWARRAAKAVLCMLRDVVVVVLFYLSLAGDHGQ